MALGLLRVLLDGIVYMTVDFVDEVEHISIAKNFVRPNGRVPHVIEKRRGSDKRQAHLSRHDGLWPPELAVVEKTSRTSNDYILDLLRHYPVLTLQLNYSIDRKVR